MTSLAYLEKWPMFRGEDGLGARVEWRRQRNEKETVNWIWSQYWFQVCMWSVVYSLCVWYLLSHVTRFATLRTVVHQTPLSMGFSRKECWRGLPFPPPGDLPQPGIKLCLLPWQADSLPLSHLGIPLISGEAVISTVLFGRSGYMKASVCGENNVVKWESPESSRERL